MHKGEQMNILLVCPRASRTTKTFPSAPLGALAIGSYAQREGHSVKIADFSATRKSIDYFLEDFTPDVVGISSISPLTIPNAVDVSRYFREKSVPVVWGGTFATIVPDQILLEGAADYVVMSEGEITFTQLLKKIEGNEEIGDLPGLVYLDKNGEPYHTPPRPFGDLQDFPKIDWSLVDIEKYWQHLPSASRSVYVYKSKGCPCQCTFCFNPYFHRSQYRQRKHEDVLEELQELAAMGADGIFFADECFCVGSEQLLSFCAKLKELNLNLSWYCQTRLGVSREELQAMYDAGCRLVFFGIETGSPRMQKLIKKNIRLEKLEETVDICREIGIITNLAIILGFPEETEEDLRQTIDLIFRASGDITAPNFFVPAPHSETWETCYPTVENPPEVTLENCYNLFSDETGAFMFSEIPRKELFVVQKFILLSSALRMPSHGKDPFFILKRYIIDTLRFAKIYGVAKGISYVFNLAKEVLIMLWYVAMYPKIRKKYGLYMRNFKKG